MNARLPVVVVGAGHAGGSAAAFLRQCGWEGGILLIGDEPIVPYHRPPLSKAWLKGETDADKLLLRPTAFYGSKGIEMRLGVRVDSVRPAERTITLENGETIAYHRLILALGSETRWLNIPGSDLDCVLRLRTLADANRLKEILTGGRRLAVVGGGYIGLEVAASARALGAEVVVIEREARILARVASPPLSEHFHKLHRANGVNILTEGTVTCLTGKSERVTGVKLSDGRVIPCDAALIGVGAAPHDSLARNAGLSCENGIVVDLQAKTSNPHIYAIGDCTSRPLPLYGRTGRLESVPNALEQARQAAADICGKAPPAPEVPWFWSDQYDRKLQIAGLSLEVSETVVRGDPAGRSFSVFRFDGTGRVQAVEAVNASADFLAAKKLISTRAIVTESVKDPTISMRHVLANNLP